MVRRAELGDLDAVTGLLAQFRDWWGKAEPSDEVIGAVAAKLLDHDHTEFLLAFNGGEAVGLCQLRYRLSVWTGADDCWLEDLFVTEAARGGGHGRALVEGAFEAARARGCRRIELDVNEQNTAALRFYESLGFTTEPKPPGRTLFISRALVEASTYADEARALHRQLWEMRELNGAQWGEIARRLRIPEERLAKIRLAALDIGIAVNEPNGRVRWLPPSGG